MRRPPLPLFALLVPLLLALPAPSAAAQSASPSPTTSAPPSSASPAPSSAPASSAPPAPHRETVHVTLADDGGTVRLRPGQSLEVALDPTPGAVWEGLEQGAPTLHVTSYRSTERDGLRAGLDALSAGRYGGSREVRPQTLSAELQHRCEVADPACAVAGRTWSVQVVVEDGPTDSSELDCSVVVARAMPSPALGTVTVTEADDGRTVTVPRDGRLQVYLDTACGGTDWTPPRADGAPLFREAASAAHRYGLTDALFTPQASGTTTVTSTLDARCLHRTDASGDGTCAVGQRAFSLTVVVGEPDDCAVGVQLSGPSRVEAGDEVELVGRARPGEAVRVLFRRRGESAFTVRRRLVADAGGAFSTTWRAVDDHRWYAETDACTSSPGLTQAVPVVTGPALVRRGETVTLRVKAAQGVRTYLFFRGAGEAFTPRRVFTGPGTTTYVATSDQRYYPLTGAVRGTPRLTQVR